MVLSLLCLFTLVLILPVMAGEYGPQKVVYHFNGDNPAVNLAGLKNMQNHVNAVGRDNLTLAALIHAQAWKMIAKGTADPGQTELMQKLVEQGAVFYFCENTRKANDLDVEKDLAVPVTLVPAGVAELVKLQDQGYRYIKP